MKRPNVLFLGNGININFDSSSSSWKKIIEDKCNENGIDYKRIADVPMNMQYKLVSKRNENSNRFTIPDGLKEEHNENKTRFILSLLNLGFDAILTTDYTYEIENAIIDSNDIAKTLSSGKYTKNLTGRKAEGTYMIHTCYQIPYNGTDMRIFHVHGEMRKPSSIIWDSYKYALLFKRILEENDKNRNKFKKAEDKGEIVKIVSWMDYFILGNVYILGYGLDYSEYDIWWLLERKQREKASKGNIYFFAPENDISYSKEKMLEILDIKVEHLGCKVEHCDKKNEEAKRKNNLEYKKFYNSIVNRIQETINSKED